MLAILHHQINLQTLSHAPIYHDDRIPECAYAGSCQWRGISYLDETNVLALFPEALTADVKAVFADQTGFVCADAAVGEKNKTSAELIP